jgi:hypothetical protein
VQIEMLSGGSEADELEDDEHDAFTDGIGHE